jgi:hypothetical protein
LCGKVDVAGSVDLGGVTPVAADHRGKTFPGQFYGIGPKRQKNEAGLGRSRGPSAEGEADSPDGAQT